MASRLLIQFAVLSDNIPRAVRAFLGLMVYFSAHPQMTAPKTNHKTRIARLSFFSFFFFFFLACSTLPLSVSSSAAFPFYLRNNFLLHLSQPCAARKVCVRCSLTLNTNFSNFEVSNVNRGWAKRKRGPKSLVPEAKSNVTSIYPRIVRLSACLSVCLVYSSFRQAVSL